MRTFLCVFKCIIISNKMYFYYKVTSYYIQFIIYGNFEKVGLYQRGVCLCRR